MSTSVPNWLVRIPATRLATLLPLFLAACAGPGAPRAPKAAAAATGTMAQPKTEAPLADGDYLVVHWEGNWRIAVAAGKLSLYPSMRINLCRHAAASRGLALDGCPTLPTTKVKTQSETQEDG
jgi:hypothetical protein